MNVKLPYEYVRAHHAMIPWSQEYSSPGQAMSPGMTKPRPDGATPGFGGDTPSYFPTHPSYSLTTVPYRVFQRLGCNHNKVNYQL